LLRNPPENLVIGRKAQQRHRARIARSAWLMKKLYQCVWLLALVGLTDCATDPVTGRSAYNYTPPPATPNR
jgi:hypothetical protein